MRGGGVALVACVALAAVLASACGARSEGRRTADAGRGADGGPRLDAGRRLDAGPRDAGRDAAARDAGGCPDAIAEGMACDTPGLTCGGPCTDPCSFCNLWRCDSFGGGSPTWTRIEAHPAPCFPCGDSLRCVENDQLCRITYSDVAGVPHDYACEPMPALCSGTPTCECLADLMFFDRCTDDPAGQVVIEHFGG